MRVERSQQALQADRDTLRRRLLIKPRHAAQDSSGGEDAPTRMQSEGTCLGECPRAARAKVERISARSGAERSWRPRPRPRDERCEQYPEEVEIDGGNPAKPYSWRERVGTLENDCHAAREGAARHPGNAAGKNTLNRQEMRRPVDDLGTGGAASYARQPRFSFVEEEQLQGLLRAVNGGKTSTQVRPYPVPVAGLYSRELGSAY